MSVRILFLDMNAYFASVEQQLQPRLRGKPVAVVPMLAETTCCIAASYEAKRCNVRTGTLVAEARRRCPNLLVVQARPATYVQIHHRIIAAVETTLPVAEVCSIDEMYCRLMGVEKEPGRAVELARAIKGAIAERVGPYLRCSVGLAPNIFLAKTATNIEKPDGLVVLTKNDLPHKLYTLDLADLTGIGRKMLARCQRKGVFTVEQLCGLSKEQLTDIWKSIEGERWWLRLRGHSVPEPATHRRTVGHSHILPPQYRTDAGARAVLVRLIHKAAVRLRALDYWAGELRVSVRYMDRGKWKDRAGLGFCRDTATILEAFAKMWEGRPPELRESRPLSVSMVLMKLVENRFAPHPLFPDEGRRLRLARTMDELNARFGRHTLYYGGMHQATESAPMRISFTNIPDPDMQA